MAASTVVAFDLKAQEVCLRLRLVRTIQLCVALESAEQVGLEPQKLVPASSMTAAYFRQLAVLPSEAEFPEVLVQHQDAEPANTGKNARIRCRM